VNGADGQRAWRAVSDEAIFQAELEKIWYRTWVYVGHVSEVPKPTTS